jgi:hypothetical protein
MMHRFRSIQSNEWEFREYGSRDLLRPLPISSVGPQMADVAFMKMTGSLGTFMLASAAWPE